MQKLIQIFISYVDINIMLVNENILPIMYNFIKRNSICIIAWNAVYKSNETVFIWLVIVLQYCKQTKYLNKQYQPKNKKLSVVDQYNEHFTLPEMANVPIWDYHLRFTIYRGTKVYWGTHIFFLHVIKNTKFQCHIKNLFIWLKTSSNDMK